MSSLGSKSNKQIDVTALVFEFGSLIGSLMMIKAELIYIMKRLPFKKGHPLQKTQLYQLDEILDSVMIYSFKESKTLDAVSFLYLHKLNDRIIICTQISQHDCPALMYGHLKANRCSDTRIPYTDHPHLMDLHYDIKGAGIK